FALRLRIPATERLDQPRLRRWNLGLLLLLTLQLLYGALMAGHKAATMAPTWPTINGDWMPAHMWSGPGFWVHFIENTILIHFIHRGLAYLLLLGTLWWTWQLFKTPGTPLFRKWRRWPLLVICIQVLLGILTVISSSGIIPGHWGIFEWMAQLHQLTGMLFLLSLVALYYLLGSRKA
ncbi:MAG TPA: COX15/CtaA family protein, partial [Sediminibacterium sp.]|nr:COX15/CtaA family protein [Sediminibacterium sp.]